MVELLSPRLMAKAFANRTLSPVEVMRHTLGHIEAYNPSLNAIYELDGEQAMRSAMNAERRWLESRPFGCLDGVPTTFKDSISLRGFRSFRGTVASPVDPEPSIEDAPVVSRLKEEGVIAIGKSTMCDLGMIPSGYSSVHGVTLNPWDLTRTPGGSSSGAAAAVAAGMHSFAIGTDIVGSIRLPAAFTGLFGFKPSQGRVPYYSPSSPALVAGPLTHGVEDAAFIMNVIARFDARDFTALPPRSIDYVEEIRTNVKPGCVGVIRDLGFRTKPSPEVLDAVEMAVRTLADLGWNVRTIEPCFTQSDLESAESFYRVRAYTEFVSFNDAQRQKAALINQWVAPAETASALDLYRWYLALQSCRERASEMMKSIDFILLPSTLTPALPAEFPLHANELFEPWMQTYVFNLSEQPAASLPMMLSASNLPVAVQIVGRRHDDVGVLRLAASLEKARGPFPLSLPARRAIEKFGSAATKL